jgi:hypothetical protein
MLDGNRTYAAARCCITVALIAMQQIDRPQHELPGAVPAPSTDGPFFSRQRDRCKPGAKPEGKKLMREGQLLA